MVDAVTATPKADDFDAAFAHLSELGDKPVGVEGLVPAPKTAEEIAAEATAAAAAEAAKTKTPEELAAEAAAVVKPAVDDAIKTPEEIAAEEAEVARVKALETAQEPVVKSSTEDVLQALVERLTPKEAPRAPEPQPEIYTPEEKTVLAKYHKDWPEVVKAEALIRRGEYRDLVGYVFQEVVKLVQPQMVQTANLAEQTMHDQLVRAIPDYDAISAPTIAWARSQPKWLQPAYEHVIAEGTVEEVKALVDLYRETSGKGKAPVTPPAKVDTELPASVKKAADALAPVSSKRSTVVQNDDPNDFEGAFAKFSAAEKV